MATRIESKSRAAKRVQGTAVWDISLGAYVTTTGKIPRLDQRGFPATAGLDITAVSRTEIA